MRFLTHYSHDGIINEQGSMHIKLMHITMHRQTLYSAKFIVKKCII